jgi:predicted NUDIX family phosphoesterase
MSQEQAKQFHTKYPEFTLAIDAKAVEEMGLTQNILDDKPFWWFEDHGGALGFSDETPNSKLVNSRLSIRQRNRLEHDETYLQLLPYVLVGYPRENAVADVTTYYRKKGHGEERLQGNRSIGWGGHPEISDIFWHENGDIDLHGTILTCIGRELGQECVFTNTRSGHEVNVWDLIQSHAALKFCGFIFDTRNPVGRVHLSLVHFLALPDYIKVTKRENEHLDGPVMTIEELKTEIVEFEPWSEIIINDHFLRRQAVRENLEMHKEQVQDAEYHRLAQAAGQAEVGGTHATTVQEAVLQAALPNMEADLAK